MSRVSSRHLYLRYDGFGGNRSLDGSFNGSFHRLSSRGSTSPRLPALDVDSVNSYLSGATADAGASTPQPHSHPSHSSSNNNHNHNHNSKNNNNNSMTSLQRPSTSHFYNTTTSLTLDGPSISAEVELAVDGRSNGRGGGIGGGSRRPTGVGVGLPIPVSSTGAPPPSHHHHRYPHRLHRPRSPPAPSSCSSSSSSSAGGPGHNGAEVAAPMASSSISSSSSPPVPLASHPHLRTTATTTTAAAPPSHPVSASEPIEALLRKEGTSRKLILMAEAMARRQVHNGWVSALPPLHSSDGFTPFGGFCSNGSAGDAGEGGDTRPSTRNGGARPPTGGRPLTGSLQNFGTPLNSPREKSRGSPNHSHHRLAPGASSSWSNSHSLDGWVADNAQTLSLLNAQKYTKAYVCVSAVLSQYSSDSVKSVILRCRRGMCSFALMNYKECLDDFQVAYHLLTELRRNQNKNNPNSSSPSDSLIPTADFNESEMMRTWIKAFIMREDYRAAETMYTRVLENRKALGISTVECRAMEQEMRALLDVERFRNSVSQENWTQALTYMTGAKCVLEDTPLRTVQAVAYLETGQADLARETLLPYLPIIPLPLKAEAATEAPPEERQLRCNVEAHYLLTTILLAKASIYSGRQYMNIAASLTQRCLQVHPCYAPAIRIGNYLLALEEFIHKIDQYHSKRLLDAMVDTITEALRLDSANTRICAMLLARRGEARLEQGRYTMAVEDCGRSLQLDGSNAKTYLTRAKAYDGLQRDLEAAADRAMAVQLNPAYESIINEEMERKAQEIRMQRQKEAAAARERQQQQQQPKRAAPRFQQQSAPPKPKASPLPTPPPGSHKRAAVARNATLYDTLSVSMQATTEQIRQAFKKLTLQCHPDKMVNESEAQQLRALEMFKAINHAHSVLSDPARRAEYDLTILIGPQR